MKKNSEFRNMQISIVDSINQVKSGAMDVKVGECVFNGTGKYFNSIRTQIEYSEMMVRFPLLAENPAMQSK